MKNSILFMILIGALHANAQQHDHSIKKNNNKGGSDKAVGKSTLHKAGKDNSGSDNGTSYDEDKPNRVSKGSSTSNEPPIITIKK